MAGLFMLTQNNFCTSEIIFNSQSNVWLYSLADDKNSLLFLPKMRFMPRIGCLFQMSLVQWQGCNEIHVLGTVYNVMFHAYWEILHLVKCNIHKPCNAFDIFINVTRFLHVHLPTGVSVTDAAYRHT